MHLLTSTPSEDSKQGLYVSTQSDQSFRFLYDDTLHPWLSKCAQCRFRPDCANAQADLNLLWALMSEGTFSDISVHITGICVNNKEVYIHDSPLLLDYSTKSEEIGWIVSIQNSISYNQETEATFYLQ